MAWKLFVVLSKGMYEEVVKHSSPNRLKESIEEWER